MRTTLVLHRRTSEKVADLRAPSGAGVHGDEVLQPLGPVARLLEELSTGRPLGLLVRIDPAAGQLQREGTQGLPPLAHEHHVSPARERYHGGEPAALQDAVLDPGPTRQLHLVHAKCAPRIAVQILPSERPPARQHAAPGLRRAPLVSTALRALSARRFAPCQHAPYGRWSAFPV